MRRFRSAVVTMGLVCLLVSATGCPKSKDAVRQARPIPAAGEIVVTLLSREKENTPKKDYKDESGIVEAVYKFESNGINATTTQTRSFSGSIEVPVTVQFSGQNLSLIDLKINDGKNQQLAYYSGQALEELKKAAKNGVNIAMVLTQDNSVAVKIEIVKSNNPPAEAAPDTDYKAIKDYFADPQDILSGNAEVTLEKLKQIASLTEKYHRDLYEVIVKAKQVDMAHLSMLADAVYFPFASYEGMRKKYDELLERNRSEDKPALVAIARNLRMATEFANYTNAIINIGTVKATDLTAENGMALLKKLYPGTGATGAMKAVFALFEPMKAEKRLELLEFAFEKQQSAAALDLGLEWFEKDSDRRVATLITLAKKYGYYERDQVVQRALPLFDELTADEVVALVQASSDTKTKVASSGIKKIKNLTAADVVKVAAVVDYYGKDTIVMLGAGLLKSFTSDEAVSLSKAASDKKNNVVLSNMGKISDLTVKNATMVASNLGYYEKDTFLEKYAKGVKTMTTDELLALSAASSEKKNQLILAYNDRVTDMTVANALKTMTRLGFYEKDTFVAAFVKKQTGLKTAELLSLSSASSDRKQELLTQNLAKVEDLNADNSVAVMARVDYYTKDNVGLQVVDLLKSATVADLVKVASAAAEKKADILVKGQKFVAAVTSPELLAMLNVPSSENRLSVASTYLKKVLDLSAAKVVEFSGKLAYYAKDTFTLEAFDVLASRNGLNASEAVVLTKGTSEKKGIVVTKYMEMTELIATAELISLANVSGEKDRVLTKYLSKLSDFTAPNAVKLAKEASYYEKDAVITGYINVARSITSQETANLSAAASEKKQFVVMSTMKKNSDFTVDNAIMLSKLLGYYEKDTYLLQAVELVTDLSAGNLSRLANAASEKKKEILEKGLKRLGG